MSHFEELTEEGVQKHHAKVTEVVQSSSSSVSSRTEHRFSPILDVHTVIPTRKKNKFDYKDGAEEADSSSGNTTSVLPEADAVSPHSMACRIEAPREV